MLADDCCFEERSAALLSRCMRRSHHIRLWTGTLPLRTSTFRRELTPSALHSPIGAAGVEDEPEGCCLARRSSAAVSRKL